MDRRVCVGTAIVDCHFQSISFTAGSSQSKVPSKLRDSSMVDFLEGSLSPASSVSSPAPSSSFSNTSRDVKKAGSPRPTSQPVSDLNLGKIHLTRLQAVFLIFVIQISEEMVQTKQVHQPTPTLINFLCGYTHYLVHYDTYAFPLNVTLGI